LAAFVPCLPAMAYLHALPTLINAWVAAILLEPVRLVQATPVPRVSNG
jgi:hypothetical protein